MSRSSLRTTVSALLVGALVAAIQLHGLGATLSPYVYRSVANLTVRETASPDPVQVGSPLTYTIDVGNAGPGRATNVTMTDKLPPTIRFVSCTPPNGTTCSLSQGVLSVKIASMKRHATARITVVAKVSKVTFNDATLGNLVTVSSFKVYDPDLGDNFAVASATAMHPCDNSWFGQTSPLVGISNEIDGVAAVAGNDVWAVGTGVYSTAPYNRTLAEHWDGSRWNVAATQDPSAFDDHLNAVTAFGTADVWAVGAYGYNFGHYYPHYSLVERWNGSTWKVVKSPASSQHVNELRAIAGVASDDLWAVGAMTDDSSGALRPLIEHWTGSSWKVVKSPTLAGLDTVLDGVWASSSLDAWAVGSGTAPGGSSRLKMVIEHWDGVQWSIMSTPYVKGSNKALMSVSGTGEGDVWAVGYDSGQGQETLILHWNASAWTRVTSPNGGRRSWLSSVAADSPSDSWAVGGTSSGGGRSLVEHWNGKGWGIVQAPPVFFQSQPGVYEQTEDALTAVSALSPSTVWAVGDAGARFGNDMAPLTERRC